MNSHTISARALGWVLVTFSITLTTGSRAALIGPQSPNLNRSQKATAAWPVSATARAIRVLSARTAATEGPSSKIGAGRIISLELPPGITLFPKTSVVAEGEPERHAPRFNWLKAFVVDERLSALRRAPSLGAQVIRRLRLGRRVYIITSSRPRRDEPRFYRVAVTRRTRGWIHRSAVAAPAIAGEDARLLALVNGTHGVERIQLSKLLTENFPRSALVPRALFNLGQECERAATSLSQRARRRLSEAGGESSDVPMREFYLSDVGLDRYSRLGIRFTFDEEASKYVYDGEAYRVIVTKFPRSPEAEQARRKLGIVASAEGRD
jgi:hypothetical protein